MRGGNHDPFDADGFEVSEPGGVALVVWSSIAAVALLLAVTAVVYGLPDAADNDVAVAEVDQGEVATPVRPTREPPFSTHLSTRTDFAMRGDAPSPDGSLARLEVENAALRHDLETIARRLSEVHERVAGLEDRLQSVTGSLPARPPERGTAPGVGGPEIPVAGAAGLSADAPLQRRTAFAVELGAFGDLGSVEAAWRELVAGAPGLFADLRPLATIRDREGRTELLLVAGPFESAAEAADRCTAAAEAGYGCLPAFFIGQPID